MGRRPQKLERSHARGEESSKGRTLERTMANGDDDDRQTPKWKERCMLRWVRRRTRLGRGQKWPHVSFFSVSSDMVPPGCSQDFFVKRLADTQPQFLWRR